MQPENNLSIENNIFKEDYQASENFFKKILSKIKNIFTLAFIRIKTAWLSIPKKTRFIISPLIILTLALLILTLVSKKFKPIDSIRRITQEDIIKQYSEGWSKLQIPQREPAFFTLKPQTQSRYGILPKETFTLKTKEALEESYIKENLNSNIPIKITSVSSTEFRITSEKVLGNDEIVSFNLPVKNKKISNHTFDRNYGWTFQTQGKFRVTSTIPGNEKKDVPLNTGIEIVFSQDDYKDPKDYITITPDIEWRGERHGETYAIIPIKKLKAKTIYTVTLKKGLNLESRNDPIGEDFTFSFQTQELADPQMTTRSPRISLNENFIQVSTNEQPPAVSVYTSNWKNDLSLKTKIYKFPNSTLFIESRKKIDEASSNWWSYFAEDQEISTENLAKVAEMDLKLQEKDNVDYIQLPETLPEGMYLVQFWYEDGKKLEQLWLQSTNISGYISVGRKQTLVWVNDVASGEPVKSAQIIPIGTSLNYSTSDNGIAVFSTPQIFYDKLIHYIKVASDKGELILPVNSLKGYTKPQEKNSNDYWSYLYHERRLYKPEDTVYFWGVIKERDTGLIPSNIKVSLTSGYYYYPPNENLPLKSVDITPDTNGSFIGNITLTNIPKGYYELSLTVNEVWIESSYLQITEYEKPEMKIEVTSEKKAIFSTEKNNFTAKVSFYDETPAKGVPLNIYKSLYSSGDKIELKTDAKGEIKYTYQPQYEKESSNYSYYPRYESITISPALAEESNIEGFGSVYVYGSKLMITSKSKQEGNKAYLSATVNKVNLDNINKGISSDVKGDIIPNKEVSMNITKTWWEKIEEGTYYDFIEKTTRPSYKYQRHDEKIVDTKLKTNGNGEISFEFNMENDKSYHLILSTSDEDNHKTYANEYYYYHKGDQDYSFYNESYESRYSGLTLDKKENTYSVGEDVNLSIKLKGENFPDNEKNRFLFILAQRGNQDFFVEEGPKFSFTFEKKHIPAIYAAAVIFTGKHYQIVSHYCSWDWACSYNYNYYNYFPSLAIYYKNSDSKLELELSSDKEKYKPGDNAKISVSVKKDGQFVSNVQVNLVLVDLALEAIGGVKKPSILGSLYRPVPAEIYYEYYSHKPFFPYPPEAERGGGGGGDYREIFKDTPFFGSAKTNEEGIANFEFKLPDNITTWSIYAQGLSENFDAGQTEGKIISSKEFFVTSNFPKEYLQKDISFITGNGFGNAIEQNQTISYEVTILKGDNQIDKKSGEGKTLKDKSFQLPYLQTGEYRAWLKGTANNLVDGVVYPFKVIESRLDLQMNKKYKIEKGNSLESISIPALNSKKPVRLILSDIGRGQYYLQLFTFCNLYSNRIEKRLAKSKANSLILEKFNEQPCKVRSEDLVVYQNYDGGISQVPWGGSVLETTVWAVLVDPNAFDKEKLTKFFEGKLNNNQGGDIQKIYSLWGLTLLGKPHINELLTLAQNSKEFQEKIISALALASIGEIEIPREIYYDLLADFAYTNKPYIRIQTPLNNNKTVDEYVKNTGLMLLLGSMVEKEYNEGLYLYIRDYQNQVEDIVIDLGKIAFISEELSKLPAEDTQIIFKSASREELIDLSKGMSKSILLLEGEIDTTKLTINSGKAEVLVNYFVTPDIFNQITQDNRLEIKREYKKVKGEGNTINPGDIVEIKVSFGLDSKEAPLGSYTITDHLPSGLTYIKNPIIYGLEKKGWAEEETNNVIKYNFYNSTWWQKYSERFFTYYARATAVGTYVAEPCIIQSNLDLSVIKSTSEEKVTIESKN